MCACTCGERAWPVYGSAAKTESVALASLSEAVLTAHRLIVLNRAGWKCELCGKIGGLEVHHNKFRSHGRDDRVANLVALCADCHREQHGGKGK
jgi:predicted restriction endonuclease